MDLGLAGATVVVQGGTRGMGFAAAECFAVEGAKVAVLGRERESLDKAVDALREGGAADVLALQADVANDTQVRAAFDAVGERWGELNVLVNAAGPTAGVGLFDQLTDEDWLAAVNVGAFGLVRCIRAALPLLRSADWARIVNLSAHSTKRQTPSLIAYTAAKAMVTSISKNLAQTLAAEEILVNTVSPGSFVSESLAKWARGVGIDPADTYAVMQGIKEHYGHPAFLPRAGLPSEIGPIIAFAASPRSSYMTGANINVDGGSDFC